MAGVRSFNNTVGMTAELDQLILRLATAHQKRAAVTWERFKTSEETRRTMSVYLAAVYFYRQELVAASQNLAIRKSAKSRLASQHLPQVAISQPELA